MGEAFLSGCVDLQATLIDSAQCFQWTERDGAFGAVLDGQPVWLAQAEGGVTCRGLTPQRAAEYLDLGRDMGEIGRACAPYPPAARAFSLCPGLRVLRQDPWETVVMFLLSANNNVPRIRSLVARVREQYGAAATSRGVTLHGFPRPEMLARAGEDSLRALGMGYRAPYLARTAAMVADGFPLRELRDMDYVRAHKMLLALPGVGDKVADCILLFGCGHAEAFPVDVWVERVMRDWFHAAGSSRAQLAVEAREMFGDAAGIVQQYLFFAARTGIYPA